VLKRAALAIPQDSGTQQFGGRQGDHTPYFAALLDEMQTLYRSHPGASW
jgi:1,2-phenylacetyl-CoA epoxidase catalytic subunit